MDKGLRQRAPDQEIERTLPDSDGAGALADQRAAIDRLFAIAAKSFEQLSDGKSREFLERSRQTGGQ